MDLHGRREAILIELRLHGTVSVADLAEHHRVSLMTVRRDLADLEADGSLRRIHGGAESVRRPAAPGGPRRAPRRDNGASSQGDAMFTLGMIVPDAHSYFPAMNLGVAEHARALGGRAYLEFTGFDEERELRCIERMVRSGVDGLIVTTAELIPQRTWKVLAETNIPVVLTERSPGLAPEGDVLESVRSDHAAGAAMAVRELSARGCKRLGGVFRDTAHAAALHSGFEATVAELPGVENVLEYVQERGSNDPEAVCAAIVRQFREREVDGVVMHPDDLAIALMSEARSAGIDIPGELSIISYADQLAEFAEIPLSSVTPPRRDVGQLAVEMCVERISAGESWDRPARHLTLRPSFTERASTAPRGN